MFNDKLNVLINTPGLQTIFIYRYIEIDLNNTSRSDRIQLNGVFIPELLSIQLASCFKINYFFLLLHTAQSAETKFFNQKYVKLLDFDSLYTFYI